jgi:glycosyltransferase involved in cell wall biosynthesis
MKPVLYLTFDSIQEGVGASQALAYVKKIAEKRQIELISFEKETPDQELVVDIQKYGINWIPLPFGKYGPVGGVGRIFRLWKKIDRSSIIHARGNLSAVAAMLRFPRFWIWDSRALHADQRKALSNDANPINYYLMRSIEYLLGRRSNAIIAITNAVVPIYVARYRISLDKIYVISTCVDTNVFYYQPRNRTNVTRILLQGTFSSAYDINMMNKIIAKFRTLGEVEVTVCTSKGSTSLWKELDYNFVQSAKYEEMPAIIAAHDIGMSIWKEDLGICLKSVASTKVAEFLAIGRPIFVNAGQGDLADIFQNNAVGVITRGGSDVEISNYVSKMIELLDSKVKEFNYSDVVGENYSLNKAIDKLNLLYSTN